MPDTRSLRPGVKAIEGIYTGARILACICLAKTNCKVRTKSFVRRHIRVPSWQLQCHAFVVSYVDGAGGWLIG